MVLLPSAWGTRTWVSPGVKEEEASLLPFLEQPERVRTSIRKRKGTGERKNCRWFIKMLLLMFGGAQVQRLFELLPFGTSIADSREKKKEKCQEIGLTNLGEGVYT